MVFSDCFVSSNQDALGKRLLTIGNELEKLIEKQDKLADKQAQNNADLREIFRDRSKLEAQRAELFQASMIRMVTDAEKYHEASKLNQEKLARIMADVESALKAITKKQ